VLIVGGGLVNGKVRLDRSPFRFMDAAWTAIQSSLVWFPARLFAKNLKVLSPELTRDSVVKFMRYGVSL
jgi:hypothetical protein